MPGELIHSSARVLEFESLRELLRAYASSPLGQERIATLAPSTDRDWIVRQQELAQEIREFRRVGGRFDFSGLIDIDLLVKEARIAGAALETTEIRDVILVVDRAAEWREIVLHPPANMKSDWHRVRALSDQIVDFTEFLRGFRNKIQPDGTLEDKASPELARIRREIEKQRRSIQESLRGYLRRLSEGGTVQDELVTIRGERFVIPVKVEQKRRVQGVVHGASSSGQTVFVEPLETIEQNNELVRLLEEELAEIHRILLEMTQRIGAKSGEILAAVDVLGELELQFAKARFAEDYNCVAVALSAKQDACGEDRCGEGLCGDGRLGRPPSTARLLLHNARHPLLERNLKAKGIAVVPVTVELEGTRRQLIITGPNTGGKTVTLKTVGLLALMAQSGLPVPADRAELPVFDSVLADIGDYQSIEQNLSTFSAHVTNIDFISRTATAQSLVLLDELGSATDPEEGAALAVAIAGHFGAIGCMTVISTHHTSLKVYAANTPGVVNASVGFDEATLQPTYELKVGVPGASAGINIARRLGLNPAIIDSARSRLGTQARDVGHFLDKLHADLREADNERLRLQDARAGTGARESAAGCRGTQRAAGQNPRDGEEAGKPAARFRISRARSRERSAGPRRRAETFQRRRAPHREDAPRIPRAVRFHRGSPLHRRRPRRPARPAAGRKARFRGRHREAEVDRTRSASRPQSRRQSLRSRDGRDENENRARRHRRSAGERPRKPQILP